MKLGVEIVTKVIGGKDKAEKNLKKLLPRFPGAFQWAKDQGAKEHAQRVNKEQE
jgi:hypothetical protein